MRKRNGLPPNVTEFRDRHGNWHIRYRAKGRPTHYFKSRPGTEEFRAELEACLAPTSTPFSKRTTSVGSGSFSALIALYYSTPGFTGLAASSRKTYRSTLERFRNAHGAKSVASIERRHIKAMLGAMSATPAAANKLLDKLRLLMALALDEGWRRDDPTLGIKGYSKKTGGFHTWSESDIAQFEGKYPIGTSARLAFSLMLYTAQRRSDMVRMGWQHVEGNKIRVKQQKTGAVLLLPIHSELWRVLANVPRTQLTFLLTEYGRAFTANGFGNRMRKWCDAAGLPDCTAHGLRKAQARRLAEAGRSNAEIKSVTGHTTDSEVARYTAAANQERLAEQAFRTTEKGR